MFTDNSAGTCCSRLFDIAALCEHVETLLVVAISTITYIPVVRHDGEVRQATSSIHLICWRIMKDERSRELRPCRLPLYSLSTKFQRLLLWHTRLHSYNVVT